MQTNFHRALDSLERNTDGVSRENLQRVFGPMAFEGLQAKGCLHPIGDFFTISEVGQRHLRDLESEARR